MLVVVVVLSNVLVMAIMLTLVSAGVLAMISAMILILARLENSVVSTGNSVIFFNFFIQYNSMNFKMDFY